MDSRGGRKAQRTDGTNRVDKFVVCVEKDQTVNGHLEKGDSGNFELYRFFHESSLGNFERTKKFCSS